MKKIIVIIGITILVLLIVIILYILKDSSIDNQVSEVQQVNYGEEINEESLNNIEEINLHDIDGKETNYVFTYQDKEFKAKYTKNNWKIIDSYLITNAKDMEIICKELIKNHPIPGKDYSSYRTAQDLVNEWELHNLAFAFLSDDSKWKENAKDVDFNPEDQGKGLEEFYKSRIEK